MYWFHLELVEGVHYKENGWLGITQIHQ